MIIHIKLTFAIFLTPDGAVRRPYGTTDKTRLHRSLKKKIMHC